MKKIVSVLAVVLILALSIMPAFAEDDVISPEATIADYKVIIIPPEHGGSGTFIYVTGVDDGHQIIRFTATPDEGYEFDGWDFNGEFVKPDDPTKPVIDLDVSGDITAIPKFKPVATPDGSKPSPAEPKPAVNPVIDDSSKSPQTGTGTYVLISVLALSVLAGAGAFVAIKKSGK